MGYTRRTQPIDPFLASRKALKNDYTTTVQIFDADQQKITQRDAPAGGVYYPTSLWKVDEVLVEHHAFVIEEGESTELLVGMYRGPDLEMLSTPLMVALPSEHP